MNLERRNKLLRAGPLAASRARVQGFTLLEIVITVLIVGVLAAIAFASYQQSMIKSRRAAAGTCLEERAQFLERFYTTNLTYTGAADPPPPCDGSLSTFYTVSFLVKPDVKVYTLQAVPQGIQTKDTQCGTLTLNQQGLRGKSGTADVKDCW